MLARGKVVEAADLLGAIGARSMEANVRRRAAEVIEGTDPDEALRQLDLAAAFWREVGAKAICDRSRSSAWRSAPQPRRTRASRSRGRAPS